MDQVAIRELMQADLEAAGLDAEKYLFERKREKTYVYPAFWYCKDCLKEYRYKGALMNHIFDKHRPKDGKKYASWRARERIDLVGKPGFPTGHTHKRKTSK